MHYLALLWRYATALLLGFAVSVSVWGYLLGSNLQRMEIDESLQRQAQSGVSLTGLAVTSDTGEAVRFARNGLAAIANRLQTLKPWLDADTASRAEAVLTEINALKDDWNMAVRTSSPNKLEDARSAATYAELARYEPRR